MWNQTANQTQTPTVTVNDFRRFMYDRFSMGDLQTITFDLSGHGVRWDNLDGNTQHGKVQSLVGWFERNGRLEALWNHCARLRPGLFPLYDGAMLEQPKPQPERIIIPVEVDTPSRDSNDDKLDQATRLIAQAMVLITEVRERQRAGLK